MQRRIVTAAVSALTFTALACLTGCGEAAEEGTMDGTSQSEEDAEYSGYVDDPRDGWVLVSTGGKAPYTTIAKRCDGSTLVYISGGDRGGISTIPVSTECD